MCVFFNISHQPETKIDFLLWLLILLGVCLLLFLKNAELSATSQEPESNIGIEKEVG